MINSSLDIKSLTTEEIKKNEDTGEFTTVTHMRKKKKKYGTCKRIRKA